MSGPSSPVNTESVVESIHDCDSLRSDMCVDCAERAVDEIATGNGTETKFICRNCGSENGTY